MRTVKSEKRGQSRKTRPEPICKSSSPKLIRGIEFIHTYSCITQSTKLLSEVVHNSLPCRIYLWAQSFNHILNYIKNLEGPTRRRRQKMLLISHCLVLTIAIFETFLIQSPHALSTGRVTHNMLLSVACFESPHADNQTKVFMLLNRVFVYFYTRRRFGFFTHLMMSANYKTRSTRGLSRYWVPSQKITHINKPQILPKPTREKYFSRTSNRSRPLRVSPTW